MIYIINIPRKTKPLSVHLNINFVLYFGVCYNKLFGHCCKICK